MSSPSRSRVVALLPMKGNSERIPGKNFKDFLGRPLFRWILDTLLSVEEIDEVVINTDARAKFAEIGLKDSDRVRIRDRRKEICGDLTSMNLVLADDVANVEAGTYLMTHSTNPLLSASTIREALVRYRSAREQGYDSLFTVNRFQSRFYRQDGSPVNHDPKNLLRTQDLPTLYEENSVLYAFSRESFQKIGARIGEKPVMFETPPFESVDIDDQRGWKLAELLGSAQ